MKQLPLLVIALLSLANTVFAQNARLQVIHNSPDPTVDVYVNGVLTLNDFAFRTATPFIDVPAGIPLSLAVAPGTSTSVADAIATFPVTFDAGKTYAVTASGVVGNATTPFTLIADDAALEAAANPAKVAVNVLHGAPDAPAVDVAVRTGSTIISNLSYGQFTPYLELDPGVYYLDVKAAGSSTIVATYKADLSALAGASLRVMASGFLASGTPAFGLYAVTATGDVVELPNTPVARVQVIHNSPSPTVDVWAGNDLLLDNFAFRTATPFIYLPAGQLINLGVAADTSTAASSAIANFPVTLENGKTYIVTASGIVGDANTPFTLNVNANAQEKAANNNSVALTVLHGSPNAPAVDVDAVFVADNVVSNLAYGSYSAYLSIPNDIYDFAVRASGNPNVVASFRANLSGLGGQAACVMASGLLGGDPAFGLYAVLPNGTVLPLGLTPTARVQVIHNSPDPTVDVYVGNTRLINDFGFRTATPYIDVPANRTITLGVAPSTSTSSADAIATFDATFTSGSTYAVTASGIVGNATTPFTLFIDDNAREAAINPTEVDFNILHGAPDAPAVDVKVFSGPTLASNVSYGEQTSYISVVPGLYKVQIFPAGSSDPLVTYDVDLNGLAGGAARVFASGLLSGTPAFGLYAALPDGTVVAFPAVANPPVATARAQFIHNAVAPTVDVYFGSEKVLDDFSFRSATPFIDVPANTNIAVGVAPANSQSVSDVIATIPVNFQENRTYIVTASGILAGSPGFSLNVYDNARETALSAGTVDVAVLHGAPDAPNVDVDALFVADNVVANLAYGEVQGYVSLPPALYDLAVRVAGTPNTAAIFRADLSAVGGAAAYVFASGLLAGSPNFGLFAALADGTVIELPTTPFSRVQIIHNSPTPTVDIYAGNSLLVNDFVFRTATPFIDVPADRNIAISVAPGTSQSVADAIASFNVNFDDTKTYSVIANGIVGNPTNPFTLVVSDAARETSAAGSVAINVFHGSPGAPAVDVAERLAGTLFGNLSYGTFGNYVVVPADEYYLDIKVAGTSAILATYFADLSVLDGQAAMIFASGFVGGIPPVFGVFAALPDGTVIQLPAAPVARVQIVHNAPDPTVDVYINGQKAIEDFEYRTATPYFYLPAGVALSVGVAPGNSQSASDIIATFPLTLTNGKTYAVFASGELGGTPGFDLIINENAQERAVDVTKFEASVFHGGTDAPAVAVLDYISGTTLIPSLAYGAFTPYVGFTPDVNIFEVTPAANLNGRVGIWGVNLEGAAGFSGIVYASGRLTDDPEFDLWVVLPNGETFPLVALTEGQVIHNSPSPTVDVYLDGDLLIEDFDFRTATPFGLLPARESFNLAVAPGNSQSVNDAIFDTDVTLSPLKTYTIIAGGEVGGAKPFDLFVYDEARVRALNSSEVDLNLFHGAPDAPEVDVRLLNGPVIFDNIEYGEFADYISVPAASYQVGVTPANDNNAIVAAYLADLTGVDGASLTLFASGYLAPAAGQPSFQVWVALADGTTFPLPVFSSTNELDDKITDLQLAPNPANAETFVRFELKAAENLRYAVRDITGRLIMEGDYGLVPAGAFNQALSVQNLNPGMYQLELVSDSGVRAAKFIVQR